MIHISDLTFSYTQGTHKKSIFRGLDLHIKRGEFLTIVGKSGTGKSTFLKMLAGILSPENGTLQLDGNPIIPGSAGYMPQKDLLLPRKTVCENMRLSEVLMKHHQIKDETIDELLALSGLTVYANAYPDELSGGMRQRVAFLRTLLTGKDLLLLDEPFAALDSLTKRDMQKWLLRLWEDSGKTIVFVTHDLEEALFLSDRIYIMEQDCASRKEILIPFSRPRESLIRFSKAFIDLRIQLEEVLANESE